MEKSHYLNWKAEFNQSNPAETSYEDNLKNFLGVDENRVYIPKDRQARIDELKSKTNHTFTRSDALFNPDKRTVGVFFESEGHEDSRKAEEIDLDRKSRASNPVFKPNTYQNEEFKKEILKTTSQSEYHKGQFIAEPINKEFNLRRTVISEYSNAKHNQTVFINPRFTSC